jgi:large subunit ribosomal protein L3
VTIFEVGERVDVIGTSKGRGFQGGVKRHGFSGGPKTHGQSDRQRAPGSIGATTTPGRIFKGKHMAGHMGSVRKTIQNLEIVRSTPSPHGAVRRGARVEERPVLVKQACRAELQRLSRTARDRATRTARRG